VNEIERMCLCWVCGNGICAEERGKFTRIGIGKSERDSKVGV